MTFLAIQINKEVVLRDGLKKHCVLYKRAHGVDNHHLNETMCLDNTFVQKFKRYYTELIAQNCEC